jgi:drug/metabolite transporter (DMT)-like permease
MSRGIAILMLTMTALFWGLAFVAQKTAMESMGPLTFIGVRFIIGGLLVLPLALNEYHRRARPLSRRDIWAIVALGLVFFLGTWLQQLGVVITTVTNSGFLTGLYVVFAPLIGLVFMRHKPHPIVWLCAPLAVIGLYYLNGGGLDRFNSGDLLVIVSAVFWAVQIVMLGIIASRTRLPIVVSCTCFLITGILSMFGAFVLEAPTFAGIAAGWVELAYAAVLSTALAFTFQAVAQQYVPPANAAIIQSLETLFAALGGALLLGERLPPIGYAGAAVLFIAIVMVEAVPALNRRTTKPAEIS